MWTPRPKLEVLAYENITERWRCSSVRASGVAGLSFPVPMLDALNDHSLDPSEYSPGSPPTCTSLSRESTYDSYPPATTDSPNLVPLLCDR